MGEIIPGIEVSMNICNTLDAIQYFLNREKSRQLEDYDFVKNNVSVAKPKTEQELKYTDEDLKSLIKFKKSQMAKLEEFEQTIQEIKILNEEIIKEWKNKY